MSGKLPDPYRVWLSEIMLQQTTVAAVIGYFRRFTLLWPDVASLAAAEDAEVRGEWAGLGYYARARNLLKCARIVANDLNGQFPTSEAALRKLPGIGPYTAAAIAAIAFDRRAAVMDGNVERVMARLFGIQALLPDARPKLHALVQVATPGVRPGDYAQAMMDLGATVCTPRSPACGICPMQPKCRAHIMGIAQVLPLKATKKPRPIRYGIAYVGCREDGALLLERRPETGLLGGMLGWPGTEWSGSLPDDEPPCAGDWRDPGETVQHSFTHFHLILHMRVANLPLDTAPVRGSFMTRGRFRYSELPTAMRKVYDLCREFL